MANYTAVLTALADPTRRAIFERLAQAPSPVGEVARELPVSRPAVSQHLKVLKSAGLVTDHPAGTRRVYSVDPAGLAAIRDYFDQFWQQSLARFQSVASQPPPGGDMTTQLPAASVTTGVDVEAPIEHAFRVFTEGIGSWWNPEHHILQAELAEMVFEPHAGGHIIDRGTDGSECRWARVLAYDPPHRVCFSWDINLRWQLEPDLAKTSEVEVTFSAEEPSRTRVVLTHRHLERHGEGWEQMRDAVSSGWSLARFAEVAAQR